MPIQCSSSLRLKTGGEELELVLRDFACIMPLSTTAMGRARLDAPQFEIIQAVMNNQLRLFQATIVEASTLVAPAA